jgi:hypothetical protein
MAERRTFYQLFVRYSAAAPGRRNTKYRQIANASTLYASNRKFMTLKRYWFIVFPKDRFGPRNFGVTAYSKTNGKDLIVDSLNKLNLQQLIENLDDNTEVIENIDIRLLDPGHVIPNMGVVTFEGVWFPNLSLR